MRYFLYVTVMMFLLGCSDGTGTQDINTISALGEKNEVVEECTPNVVVGSYFRDSTTDVSIDGNKAVIAHSNGIDIIDITDKHDPVLLGSMVIQGAINKAKIKGNLVFTYYANEAIGNLSMKVINISNVSNPMTVATIPYDIIFQDAYIESNFIHFGGEINGSISRYYSYDFSDQFNPVIAASLDLNSSADLNTTPVALGSFVQEGDMLYAQSVQSSLYVIDIADRNNPVELISLLTGASYLAKNGNTIFAGGEKQLKSYYIDMPDYLYEAGKIENNTTDFLHIANVGSNVYSFGKLDGEISISDFSDIFFPIETDEKAYVYASENMVSDDRYLYVADNLGLKIIDTCR